MADEPIVLEVEGLKELQEALKKYPDEWNRLAKETMIYGTAPIVSRARELAPFDTGRLSASIGAATGEGIMEVTRVGSEIIGRIGSKVEYAPYQEYGTRFQPGKSYLRPALAENAGEALKRFEQKINEILKRLRLR